MTEKYTLLYHINNSIIFFVFKETTVKSQGLYQGLLELNGNTVFDG